MTKQIGAGEEYYGGYNDEDDSADEERDEGCDAEDYSRDDDESNGTQVRRVMVVPRSRIG